MKKWQRTNGGRSFIIIFSQQPGVSPEEVARVLWLKVGNKGDLIPPKSLTGFIDTTKSETISCDECLSSLWFDNNRFYELLENLIEEVYVQEDGYVATILWFTDNIEEI